MTKDCCLLGCDAVYFHAKFYVTKEPFPSIFRVQDGRQQVPGKVWRLSTKLHSVTSHNPHSYLWRSGNCKVWLSTCRLLLRCHWLQQSCVVAKSPCCVSRED